MMEEKSIYFVGIKGVGMTALAVFFKQKGYRVSGSDTEDVFTTDRILRKFQIPFFTGFSSEHISKKYDFVVVTGAHGGLKNIEAQTAEKKGLQVVMHGKALGIAMRGFSGISVSGTHGKTTTSSLISSIFTHAGQDPSYVVGTSDILDLSSPGHFGEGKYFIAEADEYVTSPGSDSTPRFLWQHPEILVITNIEYDHPDAYKSITDIENAFYAFTRNLVGRKLLIACADSSSVVTILKRYEGKIITYGFSKNAMYQVGSYKFKDGRSTFDVVYKEKRVAVLQTRLAGKHNISNALAAALACLSCGLSWREIENTIKEYKGSRRRFEFISEKNTDKFYDDYAHHPSEIQATLSGAREFFPGFSMIVIFQPHTYSRTKSLFDDFVQSFGDADQVLIAPIYSSAREKKDTSVSSELLARALKKKGKDADFVADVDDALLHIRNNKNKNKLIITMGAGDIYTWQDKLHV